jgi:hypothetical protein
MNEFIVRIKPEGESAADKEIESQAADYVVEPGLLPESRRLLPSFQVSGWLTGYPSFLEKRIHRNPRDLLSHVQRTLLEHIKRDAHATYGALIDLYLALGPRGYDLRKNLLNKTKDLLAEDQFLFLSEHLDSGLKAEHLKSPVSGACLSKGAVGNLTIVNRSNAGKSKSSDPMTLAREYLKQKDASTAQVILEGALDNDPGQKDICQALLTIYREHLQQDAFFKTYYTLLGRRLAIPDKWKETEQFFLSLKNNG